MEKIGRAHVLAIKEIGYDERDCNETIPYEHERENVRVDVRCLLNN